MARVHFFSLKKEIFYFIIMSQKFREIFCYLILGFSTLEISNLLFELSPLIFHEFFLVWHGNFHLIKRCMKLKNKKIKTFSKFYRKVGVISWLLCHLIWKNYVLYWDFYSKFWIADFFTCFTHEKTSQNNFSHQNFSVYGK